MRELLLPVLLMAATPALAQTDAIAGGVIADSSIAAPVISWNRISAADDHLSLSLTGWELATTWERPLTPRRKLALSVALTPVNAHSSNRVYDRGERRRDLQYRDTSLEASFGTLDNPGERWSSDFRGVLLYERPRDVDARIRDRWQRPYIGIRTRQAYRRVRADNPFTMLFDGSEVGGTAEVFAGRRGWSRFDLDQRFGGRRGRFHFGESASVFSGQALDTVNAFLIGGSWPVAGVHPLYGYRYAEFRLDRGITANADLQFAMQPLTWIGVHASAMRAHELDARGLALSLTHDWNGVGVRVGVGAPRQQGRAVFFASVLAASFR